MWRFLFQRLMFPENTKFPEKKEESRKLDSNLLLLLVFFRQFFVNCRAAQDIVLRQNDGRIEVLG